MSSTKLSANRKSPMWQFFTTVDESLAKCDLCKKTVSYKTSISNLKKHMIRMHPTVKINVQVDLRESTSESNDANDGGNGSSSALPKNEKTQADLPVSNINSFKNTFIKTCLSCF